MLGSLAAVPGIAKRVMARWAAKAAVLLVLVGAGATAVTQGAVAVFSDTDSSASNAFTTGTVDISTSPASAFITFSTMAPGDKVTQPLTVSNAGSLALRYAVTSDADNTDTEGLRAQLDLTIKSGVTTCDNTNFGVDGTVLYGPADLGSNPAINVIGDPTQGAQAGDRTLAASANEVLCFQDGLPSSTENAFQNATTSATFAFVAEQTVNN